MTKKEVQQATVIIFGVIVVFGLIAGAIAFHKNSEDTLSAFMCLVAIVLSGCMKSYINSI
jgi:hypothetical protein